MFLVSIQALLEQEAEESREKELSEKKKQLQELERRKERTIRRLLFGREGLHPFFIHNSCPMVSRRNNTWIRRT